MVGAWAGIVLLVYFYRSQPLLQRIGLILLAFAILILVFSLNFGEENPTVANLNSVNVLPSLERRGGGLVSSTGPATSQARLSALI